MDVRCPNCQTEYELDEGRLRPGGVTVKCASCEHVFRVRRRGDTAAGMGSDTAKTSGKPRAESGSDSERSWLVRRTDGEIMVCRELATLQRWIVSGAVSQDCEISRSGKKWKPLRELTELASFFAIAEEVRSDAAPARSTAQPSRPHTIRRDSAPIVQKTGPRPPSSFGQEDQTVQLSAIAAKQPYSETEDPTIEMSLEQAQSVIEAARRGMDISDPVTPDAGPQYAKSVSGSTTSSHPASSEAHPNSTMLGASAPGPRTRATSVPPPAPAPRGRATSVPPPAPRARATSVPPPAPGSRARTQSEAAELAHGALVSAKSTPEPQEIQEDDIEEVVATLPEESPAGSAKWASNEAIRSDERGPSGPTGGLAKGVPTNDAAFAGSNINYDNVQSKEFKDGRFVASDAFQTKAHEAQRSGAGKWIVLFSLFVLLGAGAVLFLVVLDPKDPVEAVSQPPDAAVVVQADSIDAALPADAEVQVDSIAALASAVQAAVTRYERRDLEGMLTQLAQEPESLARSLAQSRVHNALAQFDLDEGTLNAKVAAKSARASRKKAKLALRTVEPLLSENATGTPELQAMAFATKADALRLSGMRSREVERWLRRAGESSAATAEERYVTAMLRIRDKRVKDAQVLLKELESSASSLRVQYRLAMLAIGQSKYDDAEAATAHILGLVTEHEDATKLATLIADKTAALAAAAANSNSNSSNSNNSNSNSSNSNSSNSNSSNSNGGAGSYDQVLEKADKFAETGNCGQATKFYERALDANPSGVAALAGLGYCQLDFKNYSSAQARFRAALGISPRYQDALWGVAEGYQQQGLKAQAIKGYRKFIDEHPTSRRADMAKRQIERLGGGEKPAPEQSAKSPAPELKPPPDTPEPIDAKVESKVDKPESEPAPEASPKPDKPVAEEDSNDTP